MCCYCTVYSCKIKYTFLKSSLSTQYDICHLRYGYCEVTINTCINTWMCFQQSTSRKIYEGYFFRI